MEAFIESYGYVFVVVGTLFGGETVLAMAGFAAHRGYLFLPWVMVAGCIGNFAENQIWFFVGRKYGMTMMKRYPSWQPRMQKMARWLRRYQVVAVIGVRFLAGFRTPGALAIGMSEMPAGGFALLNLIGALVWAAVVAVAGYFFGAVVEAIVGDIKDFDLLFIAIIGLVGVSAWLYARKRTKTARSTEDRPVAP